MVEYVGLSTTDTDVQLFSANSDFAKFGSNICSKFGRQRTVPGLPSTVEAPFQPEDKRSTGEELESLIGIDLFSDRKLSWSWFCTLLVASSTETTMPERIEW